MKTVLILALIIFGFSIGFSQTKLKPLPLSSIVIGDSTFSFEDTTVWASRVQKHFMLGWQWQGPNANTNKRLHCNFYHDHFGGSGTRALHMGLIPDSGAVKYLAWQHLQRMDGDDIWAMGSQMGIQFDPTAKDSIDLHNPVRTGDTTGAVFGFTIRDSVYGHLNSSGTNFDRYSLDTLSAGFADSMKYAGVVVLDKPVIDDHYYQFADSFFPVLSTDTADTARFTKYTNDSLKYLGISRQYGRWWYLSLNLRRTNSTDILMNNDTLITIRLPYMKSDNISSFVLFDSVAVDTVGLATSLSNGRGVVLPLRATPGGNDSTRLVITRKMLPKGNATNRDITISAFFRFKNPASAAPKNPYLRGGVISDTLPYVNKLGITARYHGRGSVSIDWLRIGTPQLERELRGELDTTIWRHTYHTLKIVRTMIDTGRNFRLQTFYGRDEVPPECYASMRYYGSLMSGRLTSEGPSYALEHAAMNYDNVWSGGIGGLVDPFIPTPIMRFGNIDDKYNLHVKFGYDSSTMTANAVGGHYGEPDGSNYETTLALGMIKIKRSDSAETNYFKNPSWTLDQIFAPTNGAPGTLGAYEWYVYQNCYKNTSLMYSGKPWWSNIWGTGGFYFKYDVNESNRDIGLNGKKQLTGEEIRSQIWTALLHGAKGLMYDRMYSDTVILKTNIDSINCDTCWGKYGQKRDNFQTGMMYDKSQIPDSLEGTSLIESDLAGGDFLSHGDKTHLDFIVNLDTIANRMGISSNRIYMGRKSMRREVMKAHDFIVANDSILMNMHLVSWFGKGFYLYQTGDTSKFSRFIAADPERFTTRPPARTRYDSTLSKSFPYYEDTDSTFYDLTLHQLGTTSLDSTFILCALNRRTAPFIMENDTIIRFVTTSEFDSIVHIHPEKKYSQSGAREITIPFNYKDTLGRFALMRVRELTGTFDTIVGQDAKFSVKFLPGEGKIFKVEILRPNEVAGELAHSNQTKIVAYPKMRREYDSTGKWIESDTIVHYMTYHKRIHGDTNGLTGVYFRKSKPASKHDNAAAIQWGATEYLLSYSVFHNDALFVDCDTCAYPSIVTRFDSVSQEYRSFVVYGCTSDYMSHPPTPEDYQYIVESVVRVRNDSVIGDYQGRALAIAAKRDMAEWGTPMVNASDTANFYCWSDAYSGIMASWKKPDTGQLVGAPLNIHWGNACSGGLYSAQHPSMNPYSRYMRGEHENDCALVWQENNECGYYIPKIFYTRLRIEDGQVRKGLSPIYSGDTSNHVLFNADTNIVCVSFADDPDFETFWNYDEHRFPVVYRDLYFADTNRTVCNFENYFPEYKRASFKYDRVYWQFLNPLIMINYAPYNKIKSRLLMFLDTVENDGFVPQFFNIGAIHGIWSSTNFLDQPVVSAGEAYNYDRTNIAATVDFFNCFNFSFRGMNLNFRSRPVWYTNLFTYGFIDTLAQIMHLPQEIFTELENVSVSTVDVGTLSQAHLVARGSLYQNDWQRNHRIYNKRDNHEALPAPPPTIRSSGQYFFRTSGSDVPIARQFYSFGDDSLSFGIAEIIIEGRKYPVKRKPFLSPIDAMKSPDTLSTEWFGVDNIETMDVITAGSAPERINVWLERRRDGATYDLPLEAGAEMTVVREILELVNGDDEEYRMRICRRDNAPYHPETAIGSEETVSLGKGSGKVKTVDLGAGDISKSVFIYPNPAREEINLTIKGTTSSEVLIISAVGGEAARLNVEGGKTVTVNTSTFPSGMYVVRVRRAGMIDAVVPFVVVR